MRSRSEHFICVRCEHEAYGEAGQQAGTELCDKCRDSQEARSVVDVKAAAYAQMYSVTGRTINGQDIQAHLPSTVAGVVWRRLRGLDSFTKLSPKEEQLKRDWVKTVQRTFAAGYQGTAPSYDFIEWVWAMKRPA